MGGPRSFDEISEAIDAQGYAGIDDGQLFPLHEPGPKLSGYVKIPLRVTGATIGERSSGLLKLDECPQSRSWRVQLGMVNTDGGVAPAGVNWGPNAMIARLQWGIGAASYAANVDWPTRGCSFCVTASNLSLGVTALNPKVDGSPATLATMIFTASLGGVQSLSAPAWPPTTTVFLGNVNAGADVDTVVPAFARSWRATRITGTETEGMVFTFFADAALAAPVWRAELKDSPNREYYDQSGVYPVPPSGSILRVHNSGAVNAQVLLTFNLDLG